MQQWQRSARLAVAVFGVAFAVFVAREWKRRDPPAAVKPTPRTDPRALVEVTAGRTTHINGAREAVDISFKKQFTYEDGTSKLEGATIVFDERNGGTRTFTITGNEGRLGKGATLPAGATVHQVTLNGSVAHYAVRDTNAGREVLVSTPCRGQTWRVHVVAG